MLEGEVYAHVGRQCAVTVDSFGDGLLIVAQQPRTAHRPNGGVMALLTAYATDEESFGAVERRWTGVVGDGARGRRSAGRAARRRPPS